MLKSTTAVLLVMSLSSCEFITNTVDPCLEDIVWSGPCEDNGDRNEADRRDGSDAGGSTGGGAGGETGGDTGGDGGEDPGEGDGGDTGGDTRGDKPGNPGNAKPVGNAGEKDDKGGFGAPPEGTGTHGRGDKDGDGNPGNMI